MGRLSRSRHGLSRGTFRDCGRWDEVQGGVGVQQIRLLVLPGEDTVEALPADASHRLAPDRRAQQLEDAVPKLLRTAVPVRGNVERRSARSLLSLREVEGDGRLAHRHVFDQLVHRAQVADRGLGIGNDADIRGRQVLRDHAVVLDPAGELDDRIQAQAPAHGSDLGQTIPVTEHHELNVLTATPGDDVMDSTHQLIQAVVGTDHAGVANQVAPTASQLVARPRIAEVRPADGVADHKGAGRVDPTALERQPADRLVGCDHDVGRAVTGALGPAGDGVGEAPFDAAPTTGAGFRHDVVLVEDELLAHQLEAPANREQEVRWIGRVDDVEAVAGKDETRIEEEEGRGDEIFDEMAEDSAQRRERDAIDADALPLFVIPGIAPLGTDDRNAEAGFHQGHGFIPDASIGLHWRVFGQKHHPPSSRAQLPIHRRLRATHRETRNSVRPRTPRLCRQVIAPGETRTPPKRASSFWKATCPSIPAIGAPKQKWPAQPKATWRLSARPRSSRSGTGKRAGSRLAAPRTPITACGSRRALPPTSTSSRATPALFWLGLSKRRSSSTPLGINHTSAL